MSDDPSEAADADEVNEVDGARTGTFLVTHAGEDDAVVRDVAGGQVITLSTNPGVTAGEALEATVAPDPPLEVTWQVVEVERRWAIELAESPEPPTTHSRELAADQGVGELTREPRAGEGEVHVLTVPEDETEAAVTDVLAAESTRERAARLGVGLVEVRSTPGVVSVRYLP